MNQSNLIENFKNNLDIRLWNDKMATKYNPELYHKKSLFLIRFIERLRVRSVLKLLAVKDDEKVLDVGCGAGNPIEYFSKGRLFGIDLCKQLLIIASCKNYGVPVYFLQSFGEKLPFKDHIFDKIFCSEVIEHIKEPYLIIKEAERVLNRDGYFLVSIPNDKFIKFIKILLHWFYLDRIINSISTYKFAIDTTSIWHEWHLHNFSLKVIKKLLNGLFQIEKIQYTPFRFFPLQIILVCKKSSLRYESPFN